MNADQAKDLYLPSIIEAAGGKRDDRKGNEGEVWFHSPFRDEKTSSLKATRGQNGRWIFTDYGTGKGGNVIAFANLVLGKEPDDRAISPALKWLRGLPAIDTTEVPRSTPAKHSSSRTPAAEKATPEPYQINKRKQIYNVKDLRYLEMRGIYKPAALEHLQHITFTDVKRDRTLYGFGLENVAGGVEISTPTEKVFKTCIGPKAFTKIENPGSYAAHVFEGMFDFLTYLTLYGLTKPKGVAYILNSVAMVEGVKADILKFAAYRQVVLWLDNDEAGEKATQQLLNDLGKHGVTVGTMNHLYEGFKDLNDWYVEKRPPAMTTAAEALSYDRTATR